jgi:hypothetical protein
MPIRWEQPFRPGLTIEAYLERCRQASLTEEERALVLSIAEAMKALGGSPVGPIFELFLADRAFRVRYGGSSVVWDSQSPRRWVREDACIDDGANVVDFIQEPPKGVDALASSVVRIVIRKTREHERTRPSRAFGKLFDQLLDALRGRHPPSPEPDTAAYQAAKRNYSLYRELRTALSGVRTLISKGTPLKAAVESTREPRFYAERRETAYLIRLRRRPLGFHAQLRMMCEWMKSEHEERLTPSDVAKVWFWRIESCFNEVRNDKLTSPAAAAARGVVAHDLIDEVDAILKAANELLTRKTRRERGALGSRSKSACRVRSKR